MNFKYLRLFYILFYNYFYGLKNTHKDVLSWTYMYIHWENIHGKFRPTIGVDLYITYGQG